jgi:NAD(P)-dependent dehydrogenase (short-subunit alcohol dehydrogenase family)
MSETKTILVTGANRGIGLEIVRQLASKGAKIFLSARNAESARKAAAAIAGQVQFLELDVSNDQSIERAAGEFAKVSTHLDVLINNAGIYPDAGFNILTIPRKQLVETFQTNTFGVVRVTQAFLPYLKKAGRARVINLSSGYGEIGGLTADVPSYCLSKLGLNGITIMLHQVLFPQGISVNSVCPGWVRTDMGGPGASRSVEEGADTAVWLATEAPESLSGKPFRDRKETTW